MRSHDRISAPVLRGIALALGFALSTAAIALIDEDGRPAIAAQTQAKIDASIFSYDGRDFVRTKTTLVTEDGKSAVDTKLDHDSPVYKALIQKHSYIGEVTVFGRTYDADYAPLISDDGRLTGALFVGVAR